MGRLLAMVGCALVLLALSGCSQSTTKQPGGGGIHAPVTEDLNPVSLDDLLKSVASAGLPVPNPRDVTQHDCPAIGCAAKVDTDTVSIIKFPTTGRAELYAGATHGVFQIEDVVLVFSPAVSSSKRADYERALERAIE